MSEVVALGTLALFSMILLFVFISTCIERYKIKYGHEASFILIIGMLLSFTLDQLTDLQKYHSKVMEYVKFNENLFFYLCLPPIVFASGFNMHRGDFFANIDSVLLFGLIGTFVCFTFFSLMTIWTTDMWEMNEINGKTGEWGPLSLQKQEILLMCSLLSSSDVVAAVSLISYEQEPALYSIVFGEGITNDAVSIILFNTVMRYTSKTSKLTWTTPFIISYEFVKLGFTSLAVGISIGMLSSLIFKTFRSLTRNPTAETMTIFIFGYISYIISEMTHNSGIITLLTCGIVMSHYTWYNLSPQGKHASFIVFEFLGKLSEAFVFIYLGVTLFSFKEYRWSWQLFVAEICIIIIGRLFGTIGLLEIATKCCGVKTNLDIKQQIFVWFAGMIRGAIAFGLVLRIDDSFENRDVIVTTSLSLVIFTTVVFGSLLGIIQKYLFGDPDKKELNSSTIGKNKSQNQASAERRKELSSERSKERDDDDDDAKKSRKKSGGEFELRFTPQHKEGLLHKNMVGEEEDEDEEQESTSSEEDSNNDEVELHPNFRSAMMNNQNDIKKKNIKYKGCKKYLHRCDLWILRPVLIYKYERRMMQASQNFYTLFKDHGEELEIDFTAQDKKQNKTVMGVKMGSESDRVGFKKYKKNKTFKEDMNSSLQGSQGEAAKKDQSQKKRRSERKPMFAQNSPIIPELAAEQINESISQPFKANQDATTPGTQSSPKKAISEAQPQHTEED